MRYLIRAAKYFVQLMVILTLLIAILMVAKVADTDISRLFVNGYDSLWQIALLMAAFALLYPKLGYARREALAPGPDEHVEPLLEKVMTAHGYAREKRAARYHSATACYASGKTGLPSPA